MAAFSPACRDPTFATVAVAGGCSGRGPGSGFRSHSTIQRERAIHGATGLTSMLTIHMRRSLPR